jgi:hypothetical protein
MSQGGRQIGSVEYDAKLNTDQLRHDADAAAQTLKTTGDAAEQAFSGKTTAAVSGLRGQLNGLKSELATGFKQGLGIAGGLGFVGIVTGGLQKVTDFLGDATAAAREDQASMDRLTASVKANVPAWDGHTDAIDAAIASAQRLAFTDDDVRDSLTVLVARTHDVGKAIELMGQAEDLARFRKMKLADASEIIGKVFSGKVAAGAKAAGIAIDKQADSTQALAQIQAATAGQAEIYAKGDEGRNDRRQIQIDELIESIGYKLQPVINTALAGLDELLDPEPSVAAGSALDTLIAKNLEAAAASGTFNASQDQVSKTLADVGGQAGDTASLVIQVGKALLSGQGEAEIGAIALGRYADQLGVSIDALNVYVQSGLKAGLTIDQMQEQLQGLVRQQAEHNRMLDRQKSNSDDAAAGTNRLTAAQARYQARLEALARSPGVNLGKLIHIPTAETIEKQAQSIGKAFPNGIAAGLESNVKKVALASADLHYAVHHPLAVLQGKGGFGWLIGQLTSDGLQRGLHSKQPEVRAAAEEKRRTIVELLTGMPAYAWGSKIATDFLAGLRDQGILKLPYGWGISGNFFGIPVGTDRSGNPTGGHTRAIGGATDPWTSYLVGEKGPEVVTMAARGGYVTSTDALRSLSGSVSHGGKVTLELGPQSIAALRGSGLSDRDIGRIAGAVAGAVGDPVGGLLTELGRMSVHPLGPSIGSTAHLRATGARSSA